MLSQSLLSIGLPTVVDNEMLPSVGLLHTVVKPTVDKPDMKTACNLRNNFACNLRKSVDISVLCWPDTILKIMLALILKF